MIVCKLDEVSFPTGRQDQAGDLMALAGDALIRGDRIAWKVLYMAARELEEKPEHGTQEADMENHRIKHFI